MIRQAPCVGPVVRQPVKAGMCNGAKSLPSWSGSVKEKEAQILTVPLRAHPQ